MTLRRSSFAAALVALSVAACASSFDSASKLKGLRVLAVQKDEPYAHPGDTVHLKMLLDDPRSAFLEVAGKDGGHRPFSVEWLAGCFNPAADAFQACVPQLIKDFEGGTLPAFATDTLDFALTLPKNIITSRPPPANTSQPRNGSAFVFFAVCAGKLLPNAHIGGSEQTPFSCQSESGQPLGADDFVVGYTEIFAYDRLTNANPLIAKTDPVDPNAPSTGFQVDGHNVPVDCIGDACLTLENEQFRLGGPSALGGAPLVDAGPSREAGLLPVVDAGLVPLDASVAFDAGGPQNPIAPAPRCGPKDAPDARCFVACTDDDQDKCPKHSVNLVVARSSAEADGVAEAIENRKVEEQMWINYYADAGKLEHDVKLLNDATAGWNDNHSADLRVPQSLGTFHVWAVAHDNRGGAQWARVTLGTKSPY